MDRLTREMTFEEEYTFLKKEVKESFDKEDRKSEPPESHCVVRRALRCIKKLVAALEPYKEYKDLEEQGLLLRLPCKVGDTVWVVTSPFNVFDDIENNKNLCDECYEAFISSVTFYKNGLQYRISAKVTNHSIGAYYNEKSFGKTVFLTQAEAEQKLKEMAKKLKEQKK